MKNKIVNLVAGRLARNTYLWCAVLYFRFSYYGFVYSLAELGFCLLLAGVLATCLYLNNLLLVPRMLVKRKYYFYLPSVAALVLAYATISSFLLRQIFIHYPNVYPNKIIWVTVGASPETIKYPVLQFIHGFIFTLLVFVFTLCWYLVDYQQKQKELAEAMEKQTAAELAFLKTQLNPHFLFNTLNNLYGLAIKKSDDTPDSILKLSSIMRYILYESDRPLVSFAKEKTIMEAYIELELLRLNNAGQMSFVINADKDYQVPPLLWMPVLENLFKHGTRFITDNLYLEFSCTIRQGVMYINSKNNFNSRPEKEVAGGIGLSNLEKRLSLIYPGKYTLSSTKENALYHLMMQINLS